MEDRWSCGQTKSIAVGDRLFLLKQGKEPRGIVASGWAISNVFEAAHYNPKSKKRTARYIQARFDVVLNADTEGIYPRQKLEIGKFAGASRMHWNTQGSGVTIPDDVAAILEEWADFLVNRNTAHSDGRQWVTYSPDEVPDSKNYYEGATKSVRVNVYERNNKARLECIRYYGWDCCVCGFNFKGAYGQMGMEFIHVHHLKPLSEVGETYQVDPVKDLGPVCPNCHAMIHNRKQPYSLEEVKQQLVNQAL